MYENQTYRIPCEKKFRLADFFEQNWDDYIKHPVGFIFPEQYKAVSAIRSCRTETLGVDYYVCNECGEISYGYHSCKNRFCPTCSWKDTLDWAKRMKDQMLDIPHRHVVFTLPHKLNDLIKDNKGILLSILFQTAADTIKDWMKHKYQLTPGIISVLHTFGEKKDWHTHIHMIVSWGGVDSNKQVTGITGEFINYDFIQTKFRCKFEDKLIKLFDEKVLYNSFKNRIDFMSFIRRVNKTHWRIQFEPSMKTPSQVIIYIGRYSKRACLSEYKITNIEGEFISFKYKDNKNKDFKGKAIVKELTLHYNDFFPRLLQHVPLPYFRLVRYYGAYAARTKSILNQLYSDNNSIDEQQDEEQVIAESEVYELTVKPKLCKNCNIEKIYMYTVFKDKEGKRIYMSRFNLKKKDDKPKQVAA